MQDYTLVKEIKEKSESNKGKHSSKKKELTQLKCKFWDTYESSA